jgi:RecB family exonuclease
MSPDAIQNRFVEEIKLRGYDDRYIDRNEEREILQIAIHQGLSVEVARAALESVCNAQGYILESSLSRLIKDQCEAAVANDGKIDEATFAQIFEKARRTAQGRKNDREIKRLVVTVMEDHALNRIKTGWFHNWYTALKRDLGMV